MSKQCATVLREFLFKYSDSVTAYSEHDSVEQLGGALVVSGEAGALPIIHRYSFSELPSDDCLEQLMACIKVNGLGVVIGNHDMTCFGGSVICSARLAETAMLLERTDITGIFCIGYCESLLSNENFKTGINASFELLNSLYSNGDIAFIHDMVTGKKQYGKAAHECSNIFCGLRTDVTSSEIIASSDVRMPEGVEDYYIRYSDYAYTYAIYSSLCRFFSDLVDELTYAAIGRVLVSETQSLVELGQECIGGFIPELEAISFAKLRRPVPETARDYFIVTHVRSKYIDELIANREKNKRSINDIKSMISELKKIWLFLLTPLREDIFLYHAQIREKNKEKERQWILLARFIKKLVIERREELAADEVLTAFSLGVSVDDLFPKQVQDELRAELRTIPSSVSDNYPSWWS